MSAVAATSTYHGAQYGAVELKAVFQKYWAIGLVIAIVIHLMIVSSYFLVELLRSEEPPTIQASKSSPKVDASS